ncbi:MAG: permease [Elusimicrobia bacterium]|nr:MAG: permease [Elusimicrobiota bacterium]
MLHAGADLVTWRLLGLTPGTRLGAALNFFVYDTAKIFLLLSVIVFAVSVLRSYVPPERARALLSRRRPYVGNALAALLGVVTPFCSCSAVPLFIGFMEAGVPLGVTFSFLVSSPMVNEVALVLLWGLFGWKVALLYVSAGLAVAVAAGLVVGRLGMEAYVEEYVFKVKVGTAPSEAPAFAERLRAAREYTADLLGGIWLYVLAGVGVGGFIHGYVPEDFLARHAGKDNPWAVPLAVLVGVPLYSNAAGVIPVVQSLMGKGLPTGTVLAFMMAVTALSVPEAMILRKVLKPRLLAAFFGVVACAIVAVGYLFNAVL